MDQPAKAIAQLASTVLSRCGELASGGELQTVELLIDLRDAVGGDRGPGDGLSLASILLLQHASRS